MVSGRDSAWLRDWCPVLCCADLAVLHSHTGMHTHFCPALPLHTRTRLPLAPRSTSARSSGLSSASTTSAGGRASRAAAGGSGAAPPTIRRPPPPGGSATLSVTMRGRGRGIRSSSTLGTRGLWRGACAGRARLPCCGSLGRQRVPWCPEAARSVGGAVALSIQPIHLPNAPQTYTTATSSQGA